METRFFLAIISMLLLTGCTAPVFLPTAAIQTAVPISAPTAAAPDLSHYAFPKTIDPAGKYLFYLHGKIVEDQNLPAVSPEFGEYEYVEILKKREAYGSIVISEQREKDADVVVYDRRTADQVRELLAAGVPEKNITVVGASKGAAIAILASHELGNQKLNFVLLAICAPDEVQSLKNDRVSLAGKVLSIYDETDDYAGSCSDLFAFSEGKGLDRHEEIVLHTGLGHGLLYKPLDEWILPVILWAGKPGCPCDPIDHPKEN
ncbi:MAG: alpha/beta hydrolase [Anaerolineaceae bacterium]